MNNKIMLEKLLSTQELSLMQSEFDYSKAEGSELLTYLINKSLILMVDWSGEAEKYKIGTFLQSRLDQLSNKKFVMNQEEVYIEIEKQEDFERGDAVAFSIKHFEKVLKKQGFSISLIQLGHDAYYIALSTSDSAKKLRKLKSDFWNFTSLEHSTGEVLYIVDCPDCGSQSIWQLPMGSPSPQNEQCECGKPLFDDMGDALVKVTIDPI
ncbi:DUF6630 family protein [Paenibacillus eucommiae]|uniref:DUF6630 domain-containing protein n=1 Tax=Paenibacillus eucommiae TaxID=1355755 RepID=A0ABS4IZC1_9BACL|nr:hypothetical protein [Paenibacillus eucommiae]MBP1992937.1 hypothetical protein [Paenibacillus eucommiae]